MGTNLEFTADEYNVITNESFFINKKRITEKIILHFGELNNKIDLLKEKFNGRLPVEVALSKGKISKGENYEGLPYLILDNPRVFAGGDVFAVRTMFWWGNFFSCTFHLSGFYFEMYKPELKNLIGKLNENENFICISKDEWHHHFRIDNYTLIKDIKEKDELYNAVLAKRFIKIAFQIPLKQHHNLESDVESFCAKVFDTLC